MGKILKGILGPFAGTVGTVVGGRWKGIDYMRSKPIPSKSNTDKQKAQRAKFSLVSRFLTVMKELIKTSFRDVTGKMTPRNSALGYMLDHAVTGDYPNIAIDYSHVLVTQGSLHNVEIVAANSTAPGKIRFQWTNNSGDGNAKATDATILVAYCPEKNRCIFNKGAGIREQGVAELETLPFSGKTVQTWIAFVTEDGKDVASSVYTGELLVL